ncbi:uncharacterized protein DUF3667 [Flavobacterium sp. 90]|uniref:DUF3667 domain-containing protein n=1 Tax=unclassified Flavobacterium TaxID=196869 RepID=UPI000EABF66E|nr:MULTISPECIES: DUF3667 domain-containing protein [unclassified Flavobacterium]RKR05292.1 uncharacterized protein DUF3667 [Flavobacterium sp. 81]TCK56606.1 uncharacterized protein DUF3667 [Flavobacterium sp. 90]
MEIICKNCKHVFHGNYCNNCGQTAETHKINAHFLWHDIQHGLLHFDVGIPYSIKELFTRPGHSIREFIEGKRVKHFKPISLVVVLATLYGLLYHYFHINVFVDQDKTTLDFDTINEWMATHYSWTTIAAIPIYTIGTSIAFRKQDYNYIEYFVLNTFKASQRLILQILMFPVLLYLNSSSHIYLYANITYALGIILIFWTNIQFFNKISVTKAFLLTLLSHIIFLICFFLILVILIAIKVLL